MNMEEKNERVIIGMGSNWRRKASMARAKSLMRQWFREVKFSHEAYTEPIGIKSGQFLNCLALIHWTGGVFNLERELKDIEILSGDSEAKRSKNIVVMDLDILLYGTEKMHAADWERPYVEEMMKDLE